MSENLATKNAEDTSVSTGREGGLKQQKWLRPRYFARELENGDYQLRVWMPGVGKGGVNVLLESDVLTVTGTRDCHYDESWTPVFREFPDGDYRLVLTLNIKLDSEKIAAHVEHGVLVLDLPIVETAKPREIPIT